MKEFFRILSFFKQSLCYLFSFHLCILFPKNKSTVFSTSVFSFCLCFLFQTFNNLCEYIISKVSTYYSSVCFSILSFCEMITLCQTSFLFSIKCVSLHGFMYSAIYQFVCEVSPLCFTCSKRFRLYFVNSFCMRKCCA